MPMYRLRGPAPYWLRHVVGKNLTVCDELAVFCLGFMGLRLSELVDVPPTSLATAAYNLNTDREVAAEIHREELGIVVQCISTSVLKIRSGPFRNRVAQDVRVGPLYEQFDVYHRGNEVDVCYWTRAGNQSLTPYLTCTFTSHPDLISPYLEWKLDTITLDFTTSHLPQSQRPLSTELLPACDWPQFFTLVFCLHYLSHLKLIFEQAEDWTTFKEILAECDCVVVSRVRRALLAAALRPDQPVLAKEAAEMEPLTILEYLIAERKLSCRVYESETGCWNSQYPSTLTVGLDMYTAT